MDLEFNPLSKQKKKWFLENAYFLSRGKNVFSYEMKKTLYKNKKTIEKQVIYASAYTLTTWRSKGVWHPGAKHNLVGPPPQKKKNRTARAFYTHIL